MAPPVAPVQGILANRRSSQGKTAPFSVPRPAVSLGRGYRRKRGGYLKRSFPKRRVTFPNQPSRSSRLERTPFWSGSNKDWRRGWIGSRICISKFCGIRVLILSTSLKTAPRGPGSRFTIPSQKGFNYRQGETRYRFPLTREPNSASSLSCNATLESPAFPLDKPVFVKLEVAYRYGEDCYHLLVRPDQPESAPFNQIEFTWARNRNDRSIPLKECENLAPEFPPILPWNAKELERSLDWFINAAAKLEQECRTLFTSDVHRIHTL